METVDARIPLGIQPPNFMSPLDVQGRMMNLKQLTANTQLKNMELAQGMQTLRDQQELSRLGADPNNIDKVTGTFTTDALTRVTNAALRQKLNQDRMSVLSRQAEVDYRTSAAADLNEKRRSEALNSVMEEAYSTYEDVRSRTGNDQAARDAFNRALVGGYDDLKASGRGGFTKDTQFKMLTPEEVGSKLITHKERVAAEEKARTAERAEETPIIKETKYAEKLKGKLADLPVGSAEARSVGKQLADVEAHIARLDRIPATGGDKIPSGYEHDPAVAGKLRPIPGGPADKDKRDVLQADALAGYRARYPYGFMPDMYGKDQPTPEKYTEDYIKAKEGGAKGMPKDVKADKPKVSNKAEFDKLKKGTIFIDSRDGKEKVKG